jgi:hypothetical protein
MATRRTGVGERRWPTTVVLLGLVIVLILADRGPIDRQATWRRVLTMLPIALITIANGGSTVRLVYGILLPSFSPSKRGRCCQPTG